MTFFSICWMKEWIIGPRQTSGSRSFTRSPIDIILRPCDSTGMILLSNIPGRPLLPSIIGTSGPYTSASMMPTAPWKLISETARFTATGDCDVADEPERHDILLAFGIVDRAERLQDRRFSHHSRGHYT